MEQEESLVEGWCTNCICKARYHVGDNNGVCVSCKCTEFDQSEDSDLYDLLKPYLLKDTEVIETNYIEDEEEPPAEPIVIALKSQTTTIFLGKASRQCNACGEIKLYKSFDGSQDPTVLCKYCAWEAFQDEQSYLEIEELEEQILEDELAYNEAIERQEGIDMVLRGLDE